MSDIDGNTLPPEAKAVSSANRGNCDGIDGSPDLDGAEGEWNYPWPENEFASEDPLCNVPLHFIKNGNDYNVYDNGNGNQVGTCTMGNEQTTPCFWGAIAGGYIEDYYCQSSVCA